jgi:hypothetical protein
MKDFGRKVGWRVAKLKAMGKDNYTDDDAAEAVRPRHLPPFIMDEISAKAQAARLEVLRLFPEPSSLGPRRELLALTEMYRDATIRADQCPRAAEQLQRVKKHVKWAYDIYPSIFQLKNLDLSENYNMNVRPLQVPNAADISRQSSGLSLATTSHPSREAGPGKSRRVPPCLVRARLRELRWIWRDGVVPADVADLATLGTARMLAELKVSYAVHLANADGRPVRMPYVAL